MWKRQAAYVWFYKCCVESCRHEALCLKKRMHIKEQKFVLRCDDGIIVNENYSSFLIVNQCSLKINFS